MDINAYQPCPCHADRKIKFCCGKQIVPELNEVMSLARARQTIAALERLDRLIAHEGEKDCLLTLKTHFHLNLMEIDKAQACNERFLKSNPRHPVGMQHRALIYLARGELDKAIQSLQDAMDGVKGSTVPVSIGNAYRVVGFELLKRHCPLAARAHLKFALSLREDDNQAIALLRNSLRLEFGSLLWKYDQTLPKAPADVPWGKTYQQVRRLAVRGQWRTAMQYLELKLLAQHPQEPVLARAVATIALWLNDTARARAAWRKYSQCPGISADDAVEAEMWVSLLSSSYGTNKLDVIHWMVEVKDWGSALSFLQDSPQAIAVDAPPGSSEQPGPQFVFALLDQPPLDSKTEPSIDNLPGVVTDLSLFGKQVDRPPRLEFTLVDTAERDRQLAQIAEILGASIDLENAERKTAYQVEEQSVPLSWYWHLPDSITKKRLSELELEKAERVLCERWTQIPMALLDDRTPAEVAGDPQYRPRLSALITHFETTERDHPYNETSVARLRDHLGIPQPERVNPQTHDPRGLPPQLLLRVDWSAASDDDLLFSFYNSLTHRNRPVSEKTGREVLRRESLQSKVPFEEICLMLASVVRDDDEAIELTKRGRKIAAGKNQSAGIWLVAELELRISRGIIDKTEELFHEIQTRYMGEPEVEARMTRLLASLGVAENESVEAVAEGTATASGAGTGPVPAGEPSVVWTPEAEKAASVGGKLWLPGDD